MTQSARAAWEREYAEVHAYTTSYRDELDRGVQFFLGYLAARGESIDGPILECACGRGRNAVPLAEAGHVVLGVDHSLVALRQFRDRITGHAARALAGTAAGTAAGAGPSPLRAQPAQHDLRQPLPVRDASVGAVLDITAVDNLVEAEYQAHYAAEIARVLRPGGWLMLVTFHRDDGYYREFKLWSARSTGEPDTLVDWVVEDPNTGIRNQLFLATELDDMFTTSTPALERVAGCRMDFIDEAAQERWTRRFHLRLYRKSST